MMSAREVDFANDVILALSRDELETIREALRQFAIHNRRHEFEARAVHADTLRDKIVNIILDSVQRRVDKEKALV
jgi:hypothetical protein